MAAVVEDADAAVVEISDQEVSIGIKEDACGATIAGVECCAVREVCACARDGGDVAVAQFADAVVVAVGDVEVSFGIKGKAGGVVELGLKGRAILKSADTGSCDGCKVSVGVEFSDGVISCVSDIEISVGIEDAVVGVVELGLKGRAVGRAITSTAREGGDVAVGDLADAVIEMVGDVEVVGLVECKCDRAVESGVVGAPVAEFGCSITREGGDLAVVECADAVVFKVCDGDVALGGHHEADGRAKS